VQLHAREPLAGHTGSSQEAQVLPEAAAEIEEAGRGRGPETVQDGGVGRGVGEGEGEEAELADAGVGPDVPGLVALEITSVQSGLVG